MASKRIKPVDLQKEISKLLKKYGEDVASTTKAVGEAVAKKAVQNLKISEDYEDRSGKYRKSFRYKTVSDYSGSVSTVYASGIGGSIGHLIEHGHMSRDGTKRIKGSPHWQPVAEEAAREFETTLAEQLQKL